MRVGMGYDVHRLTEDRDLILGGVKIPWEKGLLGHSDADVLIHAIMDALLGAAALGDIGQHFPDTDPAYEGISSVKLLEHVAALLDEKGYGVGNIDAVIIAQKPKMAPHIPQMRANIARALHMDEECLNIKATTEEKLGLPRKRRGNCIPGCLPFVQEITTDRRENYNEDFQHTDPSEKEEFVPLEEGKVKMYVCGPTVYNSDPHWKCTSDDRFRYRSPLSGIQRL